MDKNILIIGNGFDLYHGLKTKYEDFLSWAYTKYAYVIGQYGNDKNMSKKVKKCALIQYFYKVRCGEWIDCEKELEEVVDVFSIFLKNYENSSRRNKGVKSNIFTDNQRFILKCFHKYVKYSYVRRTFQVNKKYYSKIKGMDKDSFLIDLKEDLNIVIDIMDYYFSKINTSNRGLHKLACGIPPSEQILTIEPDYVINFNYTDTYKYYNIDERDVLYIHGRAESTPCNMVFGIRDKSEEDYDFIYFQKYFQRIQKLTGTVDDERFIPIPNEKGDAGKVISHFFGFSMSNTDGDIIRKVIELSDKCIIYYLDQSDYEKKVINIIDVLNKEVAIERIQNSKIEFAKIR